MGGVDSWYGRVVVVHSWMLDEDSWRRSSREDTARRLMWVSCGRSSILVLQLVIVAGS